MKASKASILTVLKMSVVYAFALSTAVACGKFTGSTTIKAGTANGVATVTANVPVAAGNMTIDIESITRQLQGSDEYGQIYWNAKVGINHSGRKISFSMFPQVEPYVQDSGKNETGSVQYEVESICGNVDCTKFGVMVFATDASNGQTFNRFEYWDLASSTSAPVNRLTNVEWATVTVAFEAISRTKLNQ